MGNAKIEFTIGGISFSGEGEDTWLTTQLDKIIEKAPDLIKIAPISQAEVTGDISGKAGMGEEAIIAQKTLPNFLREKNAQSEQVKKFLATAVWLHARGSTRLSTGDITRALRESNQTRLGNPSDCLNKNVAKGYAEKDGKQFFVTEEGKASI